MSPTTCTHKAPDPAHTFTQSSWTSRRLTLASKAHKAHVPGNARTTPWHSNCLTPHLPAPMLQEKAFDTHPPTRCQGQHLLHYLCLSLLRLPQQNTAVWVASTAEIYLLTVAEAGSQRSRYQEGYQQGWFLLRPLSLAFRWPSSPCVLTWSSLYVCCVQISS